MGAGPRQYRILDVVGRGGFGVVYRGEVHGPGGFVKAVALKVLHPQIEAHPQHLARLRDEARVLGLVRHRALVGVDGLIKLLDRWTVVMEYVEGASLAELLSDFGKLPLSIALQIIEEVSNGLHAAYTSTDADGSPMRLLHRDVKPSNIRLTRFGEVKLLDFGVARAEFAAREAATASVVFGSVPYLAPERLDLEDSHVSDVYALAVTLIQLITGTLPISPSGDPDRHEARVEAGCRDLARAGGNADLIHLVRRAVAFDPKVRPDAREFARSCKAIAAALPEADLIEWSSKAVEQSQLGREKEVGEFTGMLVAEATTTERQRHLTDLFGSSAPTTFDDPVTVEAPADSGSQAVTEVAAAKMPTPHPVAPQRSPPPPAPQSSARRWRRWLFGGVFLTGVAGVFAVLLTVSAAAGGSVMLGGLVAAALSDGPAFCQTAIRGVRTDLAGTRGMRKAQPMLDRANKGCRDGSIGRWDALRFASSVRRAADDGTVSESELAMLDGLVSELLSGP